MSILTEQQFEKYREMVISNESDETIRQFLIENVSDNALVYKYFRGNKTDISTIKSHQLWAGNAFLQNDPFDSLVLPNCKRKEKYNDNDPLELAQAIEDNNTQIKREEEAYTNQQNTYIVAFSETNDNILLWSHYAFNHYGVCLGYRIKDILKEYYLFPVIYASGCNSNSNDLEKTVTKSIVWQYENEWRIVQKLSTYDKGMRIDNLIPKEVILGERTGRIPRFYNEISDYASFADWFDMAIAMKIPVSVIYPQIGGDYGLVKKEIKHLPY